ncbi:Proton glutamate symport protein [Rubripirellula obstinata]|uniref:Proton glutamate symport protein n=1 Tax=Rubripirellula obstinata TaxID=406547 RepID=A0A5B1CET6_9BACT|nr:dicarboxylate/amino acid:cation symporter [Rubripirellula obstinata]KAA1258741.1 Proton glutamate symport protein [Rubripirellula obstinata]
MKNLALHWKIIIGMFAGILFGAIAVRTGWQEFTIDWIKPFGVIFINLLKLIAMPLIVASLIKGVSDLKDISKLSKMGGRTIAIYLMTTMISVSVGLLVVNIVKPGKTIKEATRIEMMEKFGGENGAGDKIALAEQQKQSGPLQALVDLVPNNILEAAADNGQMLKVIFFVLMFGIGMILIPESEAAPVKSFFDGINSVILKIIDLIMECAPIGVFALMASLIVELPSVDVFIALLWYAACVVFGLGFMTIVFYPSMVKLFTGCGYAFFAKGIAPAQLVAFSTSSSAATLPVTMERAEEHLGVDDEVASFVLPIGATINMDGTALYQGVAAVFIAQAFNLELSLSAQLGIVMTATLASIGTAAVPSAGMVMLVIILGQAGIPEAGLALIFAIDRPLDMLRTVTNVTSDTSVSMLVAKSLGKLGEPSAEPVNAVTDQG